MNDILTVDGTTYAVNIVRLTERASIATKYKVQTEDLEEHREPSGVFFDYELVLGQIQNQATMLALFDALLTLDESHTVVLPHGSGLMTFTAMIDGAERDLLKRKNSVNMWGGMTLRFTAKKPQITE